MKRLLKFFWRVGKWYEKSMDYIRMMIVLLGKRMFRGKGSKVILLEIKLS